MKKIIVIAGPTAVGKTALSIRLAKELDAEVVSSDSMQIYKGLDIGTAKPSVEERCGIPHHMIDVCEPYEKYSVADYTKNASAVIDEIHGRGKTAIVVGGTGLYIDHLLFKTDFSEGDSDPAIREKLMKKAEEKGGAELKKELAQFDPESALRLHDNDIKRIVRAMEFYYVSGVTISEHNEKNKLKERRYDFDYYVLNCQDRRVLYERIDLRVDMMLEQGLIEEARRVCFSDWFHSSTAAQAIGYKEFLPYFNQETTLDECVALLKQHSRNYAKRQLTWFRGREYVEFLDIFDVQSPFDKIMLSRGKEN